MATDSPSPDRDDLSDDEVQRVSERAAQLDMRASESLTIEQGSAIAGEAGISQHALETAMGEVLQDRDPLSAAVVLDDAREIQGLNQPARWSRPAWFLAGALAISVAAALLYVIAAVLQQIGN